MLLNSIDYNTYVSMGYSVLPTYSELVKEATKRNKFN